MAPVLTLTTTDAVALRTARGHVRVSHEVVDLEGPGAVNCLQGIFTNDVEKLADGALAWGATLTPKGMIVTDFWAWRRGTTIRLVVPAAGAEPLLALVGRSFPPRLAKAVRRPELAVAWCTGGIPEAAGEVEVGVPEHAAPFTALVVGEAAALEVLTTGADPFPALPEPRAEELRLLWGWPAVGHEVDEKTLPQEVRFDELHGVRYDKGCYVGQETVARLHFRGHANRSLRGVRGSGQLPDGREVVAGPERREMGTITTIGELPGGGWFGIGKIRREVADGDAVEVAGAPAVVTPLPATATP